jgi:uncharacterized membrane protein YheB (UPF0754 family)
LDLATVWIYVAPPVAGAIIGYFTNDIAIKMLFRPYKALYIGKRQLPFTPGLIPRNQARLANRIADTIMGSLLTPGELQNLAQRLLQTERVQGAILWLLQLALDQVKVDKEQKTAKILASILRDLFGESLPRLLKVLARREDFWKPKLTKFSIKFYWTFSSVKHRHESFLIGCCRSFSLLILCDKRWLTF